MCEPQPTAFYRFELKANDPEVQTKRVDSAAMWMRNVDVNVVYICRTVVFFYAIQRCPIRMYKTAVSAASDVENIFQLMVQDERL